MKLTVLGSAAAAINKSKNFRFSSCHLIEAGDTKILLDAGIGVMPQLTKINYRIADMDIIALSHLHHDHFAIGPLMQALFLEGKSSGQKPTIHIIGPKGIKQTCQDIFEVSFSFKNDFLANVDATFSEYDKTLEIEGVSITGYRTKHYALEAYAIRVEYNNKVISYSGDTAFDDGVIVTAKNCDLFLCESAVDIGYPENPGHVDPCDAAKIAKIAKSKKLVLTHYTGNDTDAAMVKNAKSSGYEGDVHISNDMSRYEV